MATLFKPNDDDKDNKLVQQGQAQGGGMSGGESAPKKASSGNFTNLQSYLKPNKSVDMVGQVKGAFDQKAQVANQAVQAGQNQFNQDLQKGQEPYTKVLGGKSAEQYTKEAIDSAKAGNEVSGFENVRDANYAGPTMWSNDALGRAQSNVSSVASLGNALNSGQTRGSALKQIYGGQGRDYNRGMSLLDNALISSDKTKAAQLRSLANAGMQQKQMLNSQLAASAAAAQAEQQNAENIRTQTRNTLGTTKTNNLTAAENLAKNYNDLADDEYKNILNNQISYNLANKFGLEKGMDLYGAELKDLISRGASADVPGVLTEEQAKTLNAVGKLAGTGDTQYQKGSFSANNLFADSGIKAEIENRRKQYESKKASLDAELQDALQKGDHYNQSRQALGSGSDREKWRIAHEKADARRDAAIAALEDLNRKYRNGKTLNVLGAPTDPGVGTGSNASLITLPEG